MIIRARAPLRLGLAGGGSDVSPFCDIHGGYVLNTTIDRYAYASVRLLSGLETKFIATDQQLEKVVSIKTIPTLNGHLDLHLAVYIEMMRTYNNCKLIPLELVTYCDAPPGSGLGSSSTLVTVMIKAYDELLKLKLDEYTIANLSYRVERIICNQQGGRQDQYSATFGGINFMEFYAGERAVINPLRIKNWIICELEASLLLYYTGLSRDSARIIEDQCKNVQEGLPDAIDAMQGIKNEALLMKEYLLKGNFEGFVDSMRQGWVSKKLSSSSVSNPLIDEVYDAAIQAGALAGKVSGAGGGGYIMFFVQPEKRMDVIRLLDKFGGHVSNCHFTKNGAQSWSV